MNGILAKRKKLLRMPVNQHTNKINFIETEKATVMGCSEIVSEECELRQKRKIQFHLFIPPCHIEKFVVARCINFLSILTFVAMLFCIYALSLEIFCCHCYGISVK